MLETIADGVWGAQRDFFAGGVHFRGRMTIVKLRDGSLWVHSPVALDDELVRRIGTLGRVRYVIAPNCFHHVHVSRFLQDFGSAELWGPAALQRKRKDLEFAGTLGEASSPWADDIETVEVQGAPRASEFVFLHRPSRSLIVTDLVFNIHSCKGLMSHVLFRLIGAYGKLAQSRSWKFLIKDRNAAASSAEEILRLDFDRLIVAHGEIVDADAKARLRQALGRMLPRSRAAAALPS